jgi:hypothetical protein
MDEVTSPEVGTASEGAVEAVDTQVDQAETSGYEGASESESTETPEYAFTLEDGTGVTLDEARNGYQRQSDYTRKTQQVAQERERLAQAEQLWRAFEADPQQTLRVLSERFGVDVAEQMQDDFSDPDPYQERFQEYDTFIQEQREQAARAEVFQTLSELKSRFGDFDQDSLLEHAMHYQIPDLEVALVHKRAVDAEAAKAASAQQAQAAKQGLPPIAGGSRAATTSAAKRSGPPRSVKEALMETLSEAGMSSMPPIDFP